jgi:hypothetical protein
MRKNGHFTLIISLLTLIFWSTAGYSDSAGNQKKIVARTINRIGNTLFYRINSGCILNGGIIHRDPLEGGTVFTIKKLGDGKIIVVPVFTTDFHHISMSPIINMGKALAHNYLATDILGKAQVKSGNPVLSPFANY